MIHVLIERNIAEGMLSTYQAQCQKALQQSHVEPGFISGEVFYDKQDKNHQFVLCKWRTEQDWNRWKNSSQRLEIMNAIAPVLVQPERISVLEH